MRLFSQISFSFSFSFFWRKWKSIQGKNFLDCINYRPNENELKLKLLDDGSFIIVTI